MIRFSTGTRRCEKHFSVSLSLEVNVCTLFILRLVFNRCQIYFFSTPVSAALFTGILNRTLLHKDTADITARHYSGHGAVWAW